MPVFIAKINNTEVEINYKLEEREILERVIKKINKEIKLLDNQDGKISDSKLIAFYSIKLQAELIEQNKIIDSNNELENKNINYKNENIQLNKEIYNLKKKIEKLDLENKKYNDELDKIMNQISYVSSLIKSLHE